MGYDLHTRTKQYFEMLVVRGKNKNISRTHTTKSAIQFVATLCPLRLLCESLRAFLCALCVRFKLSIYTTKMDYCIAVKVSWGILTAKGVKNLYRCDICNRPISLA